MNGMFTDRVKKVMQIAREESVRLGNDYVGTEHLLLGLVKEGDGVAVAVMRSMGVDLDDLSGNIEVSGTITEFRFANPHAIVKFDVIGDDGEMQHWTAETTSPSILRRRGWSQNSFHPGEKITIQGLPSVDGSYLVRITRAFREDGTEIGVPRGTDN